MFFYNLLSIILCTTSGFKSVDTSPKLSSSLCAILRKIRRIILPERVLGNPGAHCIKSGEAIGPIFSLIVFFKSKVKFQFKFHGDPEYFSPHPVDLTENIRSTQNLLLSNSAGFDRKK